MHNSILPRHGRQLYYSSCSCSCDTLQRSSLHKSSKITNSFSIVGRSGLDPPPGIRNIPQHRPKHFSSSPPSTTFPLNNASIQKLEQQLSALQSQLQQLTHLLQQSQSQTTHTQSLLQRAEARSQTIETKLSQLQSHLDTLPTTSLPRHLTNTIQRIGANQLLTHKYTKLLTNKYIAWFTLGSLLLFWQYRWTMYQRTSEEVANVAALTLRQDSLRSTIQETLTAVANSPETLSSLSSLLRSLIREERTEGQLVDLIVRALNSEGVRLAAIRLLDTCFRNEGLQSRAGDFLKVAAERAVRSAVLGPWREGRGVGKVGGEDGVVGPMEIVICEQGSMIDES